MACGQQAFYLLKEPEDLSSALRDRSADSLRHLKQRTDMWLEAREDGAISSSEIGAALNFYGLTQAKAIQEKIWGKVRRKGKLMSLQFI